jgi:hypothetical protein
MGLWDWKRMRLGEDLNTPGWDYEKTAFMKRWNSRTSKKILDYACSNKNFRTVRDRDKRNNDVHRC